MPREVIILFGFDLACSHICSLGSLAEQSTWQEHPDWRVAIYTMDDVSQARAGASSIEPAAQSYPSMAGARSCATSSASSTKPKLSELNSCNSCSWHHRCLELPHPRCFLRNTQKVVKWVDRNTKRSCKMGCHRSDKCQRVQSRSGRHDGNARAESTQVCPLRRCWILEQRDF